MTGTLAVARLVSAALIACAGALGAVLPAAGAEAVIGRRRGDRPQVSARLCLTGR